MLYGSRVVVVVPAFDERCHVRSVVEGLPGYVDSVVVVDDASHDDTTVEALAARKRNVHVVKHTRNRGVGAAILTGYRLGILLTRHPKDVLAVVAGDGQMAPTDLYALVVAVRNGAGYAKGDRLGHTSRCEMPVPRRWGGVILSALTSWALGFRVGDSQCGYTAISRRACASLCTRDVYPGFGYPNTLLLELQKRGVPIVEVPVRAVYGQEVSHLRWWHVPRIVWMVVRGGVLRRVRPNDSVASYCSSPPASPQHLNREQHEVFTAETASGSPWAN